MEDCKKCINYNNCCENKEEMIRARKEIKDLSRQFDCWFSLKVNCDYFVKDKSKENGCSIRK